jgi:hypothetical protein
LKNESDLKETKYEIPSQPIVDPDTSSLIQKAIQNKNKGI